MQAQCSPIRAKAISTLIKRQAFPLLRQSRGTAAGAPTQAPSPHPVVQFQECKRPKATGASAPESTCIGTLRARLRWKLPGSRSDLERRLLLLPRHIVPPAQRPVLRPLRLSDLTGLHRGDLIDG